MTRDQLRYSDYEVYGETLLSRLSNTAEDEAWLYKILSLTWTAGPVTAVGLYLSYWLAYKKLPNLDLLFYFGTFALFTGLISLVSSIFYKLTIETRKKDSQRILLDVITELPELILTVRNENIAHLNSPDKKFTAAAYLLEDPDASESSLVTAVELITQCPEMARKVAEFETYRKKGLFSLIEEQRLQTIETYEEELKALREQDPYVARLIYRRLQGKPPSKAVGRVRERGFLKHIIAAQICQNLRLIRLKDTEELLTLVLELLLGRRYTVLRWKLSGGHPLAEAARKRDRLKQRHNRFINRRIQITEDLVDILEEYLDVSDIHLDENEEQLSEANLYQLSSKTQELEKLDHLDQRERDEVIKEAQDKIRELVRLMNALKVSTDKMTALIKDFYRIRRQYGANLPLNFLKNRSGSGIYFERTQIRLTAEQKVRLAEQLSGLLRPFSINRTHTQILLESDDFAPPQTLSPYMIASLTNDIFVALNKYINLSEVVTRDALEASTSIYISPIEWGLSKRTKFGWLTASVEEIENRLGPVAYKTAQRMIKYFSGRLSPQHLHFLKEEFGIQLDETQAADLARRTPPAVTTPSVSESHVKTTTWSRR